MMLQTEEDAPLVSRIVSGERSLFERLVRRYNQRFYRAARAQLGDDTRAEDATQQAWLAIFSALPQWTGRGSFAGWALTIVLNTCRRQRGPLSMSDEFDPDETDGALPGPDEEVHRHQLRAVLERNVDALSPALRTVLVLRDVEGLSGAEVAAALGVTEEVVRVRLHRARRSMQAALATQMADGGRELFSFLGSRCDAMTAAVMRALDGGDA